MLNDSETRRYLSEMRYRSVFLLGDHVWCYKLMIKQYALGSVPRTFCKSLKAFLTEVNYYVYFAAHVLDVHDVNMTPKTRKASGMAMRAAETLIIYSVPITDDI